MPSDNKILAKSLGLLVGLGIAGLFLLRRALRLTAKKDYGAFIDYFELLPPPPPPPPSAPLPLSGLTFAIKDMYVSRVSRPFFPAEEFLAKVASLNHQRTKKHELVFSSFE
jgi:hypothetical protein